MATSRRVLKADREFIYNRDEHKCLKCQSTENLTIDHIIPLSKDGKNHIDNYQTLCKECNQEKSSFTRDYRAKSGEEIHQMLSDSYSDLKVKYDNLRNHFMSFLEEREELKLKKIELEIREKDLKNRIAQIEEKQVKEKTLVNKISRYENINRDASGEIKFLKSEIQRLKMLGYDSSVSSIKATLEIERNDYKILRESYEELRKQNVILKQNVPFSSPTAKVKKPDCIIGGEGKDLIYEFAVIMGDINKCNKLRYHWLRDGIVGYYNELKFKKEVYRLDEDKFDRGIVLLDKITLLVNEFFESE